MSDGVTRWLEELGLGRYSEVFVENDIDFRALPELTDQDLKDLGVSLGHRRLLQKAIAALSEHREESPDFLVAASRTSDPAANLAAWERHPGERKPVTMLVADISGSTAVTEKLDAEETHDLLYGATQRMAIAHARRLWAGSRTSINSGAY